MINKIDKEGLLSIINKIDAQANKLTSWCEKNILFDINLIDFLNIFGEYATYHMLPRNIIDFIPKNKIKETLSTLKEIRLKTEELPDIAEKKIISCLNKKAKELSLENHLLHCLTKKDLINYLETNKLPEKKDLQRRYLKCMLINHKQKQTVKVGFFAQKEEEKLFKKENISFLKGQIAHKGITKGIARIIANPYSFKQFNQGDILISPMTRPDFLPLMNKASAIITDAGGLLCHAAIVAREIGKPCIIGTKNATSIFSDGDLVEVNANKGIVRKL